MLYLDQAPEGGGGMVESRLQRIRFRHPLDGGLDFTLRLSRSSLRSLRALIRRAFGA
jgi:hypothetical protein